jgi:membrane protease YdiL (CAAX protease family)
MTRSDPTAIATAFALLLLLGLPLLAAWDTRRGVDLEAAAEHRRALYVSVALSLSMITSLTVAVILWQDVSAESLGWTVTDARRELAWGAGTTAVGLGLTWLITRFAALAGWEESPLALILMPRDAGEKRGFLLLSGIAAVCEEVLFRGFLLWVFVAWLDSPWVAAAIVSLSFGLAHGYQKLAGILRAAMLGMMLAVPTLITGSLFPAIVAHFWINAAVGLGGWRYLLDIDDQMR